MPKVTNLYPLLNAKDFKSIAQLTGYSASRVRQILRGYVHRTKRHDSIIREADKLQNLKLAELNHQA